MNKSVILFNLSLPVDIINYICSYNFYNKEQCIKNVKENKNNVLKNIKNVLYENDLYERYNDISIEIYNQNKILHFHICKCCNNYIITDHLIHTNVLCHCHYEYRTKIQLLFNLYFIYYS